MELDPVGNKNSLLNLNLQYNARDNGTRQIRYVYQIDMCMCTMNVHVTFELNLWMGLFQRESDDDDDEDDDAP